MRTTGDEHGEFPPFSREEALKKYPTMATDELSANAMGGTEMLKKALYERLDPKLRDEFQFVASRVREIDPTRPVILWLHDLWDDPEVANLRDGDWRRRFAKLVFVSDWQMSTYNLGLGVPYHDSMVLKNAIEPIPVEGKNRGLVRLIYHTTPHRGLEILVPVFTKIYEELTQNIHLDVFSSFEMYGWRERDAEYEELFETCRKHEAITYHGYQPNDVVRGALKEAHIFAYPSIWKETSCLAAMEAMSAGCHVVCPNYGALPETCGNFAHMYQWDEDPQAHARTFARWLLNAIELVEETGFDDRLKFQKMYADAFYSWQTRIVQWEAFLSNLLKERRR